MRADFFIESHALARVFPQIGLIHLRPIYRSIFQARLFHLRNFAFFDFLERALIFNFAFDSIFSQLRRRFCRCARMERNRHRVPAQNLSIPGWTPMTPVLRFATNEVARNRLSVDLVEENRAVLIVHHERCLVVLQSAPKDVLHRPEG